MIYTHRTVFKLITNEYLKRKCRYLNMPNLFDLYKTDDDVFKSLEYLSAKGLVDLKFDIDDYIYRIDLTEKGITHYEDNRHKRIQILVTIVVSVITALITTSITEIISHIIQFL